MLMPGVGSMEAILVSVRGLIQSSNSSDGLFFCMDANMFCVVVAAAAIAKVVTSVVLSRLLNTATASSRCK